MSEDDSNRKSKTKKNKDYLDVFMKLNPTKNNLNKLREYLKNNNRSKNESDWKKGIREILNIKSLKSEVYDNILECIEHAERNLVQNQEG